MPQTMRRLGGSWYARVPADPGPGPEVLAQQLSDSQVASRASKRIDSFERYHSQHQDHRRAVIRGMLGGLGLVLSVTPSVPATVTSCRDGEAGECALRLSAMAGGVLALGVTFWAFYDVWAHPVRLSDHIAKLNTELNACMHARTGETAVSNIFDVYRQMSRPERETLKALLHERARQPRTVEAAARAEALAGEEAASDGYESAAGAEDIP